MHNNKKIKIDNQVFPKSVTFQCNIENEYEMKSRAEMFDSGENSDVEFIVGSIENQETFRAHRFILMFGSRKFREILNANKKNKKISIPEVKPDEFEILLRTIYTNRFDLKSIRSAAIYAKLFEEYGITSAAKECYDYMNSKENLTEDTSISIYETTEPNPNNEEISKECLYLFRANTRNILASESFFRAKIDTIVKIFEQPELCIQSELDLLIALEAYAQVHNALPGHNVGGNHDRFLTLVRPALCLIRFYTVNASDLLMCNSAKILLSPEELLAVVANILVPQNSLYKFPEYFSNSIVHRSMLERSESKHSLNSSGICIKSTNHSVVVHEATTIWDVTDLAKRVNPTPTQSLIGNDLEQDERPLGNSTVDSVKLTIDEKVPDGNILNSKTSYSYNIFPLLEKNGAKDVSKADSVLSETPSTLAENNDDNKMKTGFMAPTKKVLNGQKNSPSANSFNYGAIKKKPAKTVTANNDDELWD